MNDEDFELPNSPLNQYLIENNIETNIYSAQNENTQNNNYHLKIEKINSKIANPKLSIISTIRNSLLNYLIIRQFGKFINKNLHLLSILDEQLIRNEIFKKHFDSLKFNLSSFFTILCLFMISYVTSIYFAIAGFSTLILDIAVTAISTKYISNRIRQYDKNLKDFLVFLRQIELSSLNYSLQQNLSINEAVLIHISNFLNEIIQEFNIMNKNLYLHYNNCTHQHLELICLVEEKNNSKDLKPSYSSIKCLVKLNYLQISEILKLISLNCLNFNTKSIFESNMVLNILKISWNIMNIEKKSNKLLEIIKLNEYSNQQKQTKFLSKHSSLSIHLRNALLLSYQLDNDKNNQEIVENLTKMFNLCNLYLKKLQESNNQVVITSQETLKTFPENKIDEPEEKINEIKIDDFNEDLVIFEAIPSINEIKTCQNIDYEIDNYENEILSRNLLAELNQALIDKKKAWKEREKLAVKLISDDNNVIHKREDKFDFDHETLDNSMYKNKAKLRKTRKEYERNKISINKPNESFLTSLANELRAKRNELLSNNDDDEIVFE